RRTRVASEQPGTRGRAYRDGHRAGQRASPRPAGRYPYHLGAEFDRVLAKPREVSTMRQTEGTEAGVVLITTLLLITLLLAVAAGALMLSRTDLLISRNLLTGAQALWLAQTGSEMGKNWLEENLAGALLPMTLGPEELAAGTYTVRIATLGNAEYQLTASGAAA